MDWLSARRRASRDQVLSGDVIFEANSLLHTAGEFFPALLTVNVITLTCSVQGS